MVKYELCRLRVMAYNKYENYEVVSIKTIKRFLFGLMTTYIIHIIIENSVSAHESNIMHDSQQDFEVVYPTIIRRSARGRRQVSGANESDAKSKSLRIRFSAFNRSFDALLNLNKMFIAPIATVQVLGHEGDILHNSNLDNCFYNGKLESEIESFVTMAYCENLNGMIHTNEARYLIKPLNKVHNRSRTATPHIVQRQLHTHTNRSRKKQNPRTEEKTGGMVSKLRTRRTVDNGKPGEQTIETLLVVDEKMVQYHGLDAAKQYALTIASIAHDILRDPTIGANSVNLVVVKVLIMVADQENLLINHHARNTLISFGNWASLQSEDNDGNANSFDYAVLLTRFNVCKDSEEPCDNSGLSFTGGMCKFPTSASLIEDNGLSSAFALAHQTGHNLGMQHDGIGNTCDGQNRIMDENGGRAEGAFLWSTCSAEYLQNFLRTDQSKCLDDLPPQKDINEMSVYRSPGVIFDIDDQCRLFAGKHSKGCYYSDPVEICIELLCYVPEQPSCVGSGKPAADGTSCGTLKWCKHGRCMEQHFPDSVAVDGGWSAWTEFNTCTRPCGGGVMYRERKCHNPKPKHGGKFCQGDPRQYRICHPEACVDSAVNFRKQQCKKKSGTFLGDRKYDWTFIGTNEFACYLNCSAESNNNITKSFGRAVDGTNCYVQTRNMPGRCVAGECITVGCDLVLGSKEKADRCGVCNGDGSSCKQALESGQPEAALFVNVTDKKAKTVEANPPENNATGLVNATILAIHDENITIDNSTTSNKSLDHSPINSTGNLPDIDHVTSVLQKLKSLRTLMKAVLRRRCSGDSKCLMRYKYFDLKHKRMEVVRPKDYEWVILSSGCSVTCGIGTTTLFSECRRVDDGSPVARKFCNQKLEPVVKKKACNMPSCPTKWATGDWDSCSKSCGGGIQSRDVYCTKFISENFVLSSSMCNELLKPVSKQICNKDVCPAKWVTEQFGKCSTTCGKGIQHREVFCKLSKPNKSHIIVDDSQCKAIEKPQGEMVCNVHNPCPGDDSCGGNFTKDSGVLNSPDFPNYYPNSKECVSEISVARGKVIMLEFNMLKIGDLTDSINKCGGDFLRVTDGSCVDAANFPYTTYCGLQKPNDLFISAQNQLCLKFVSDDAKSNQGYAVKYTAIDKSQNDAKFVDICDVHGKTVTSLFGGIISPNYPDVYPVNEYCKLTISAPDGDGFAISFKGFNVGTRATNGKCSDDYLQIDHDGGSRKLCGDERTVKISIPGNVFTVSFHSMDIRITGIGFVLTYITKKFYKQQLDLVRRKQQDKSMKKNVIDQRKSSANNAKVISDTTSLKNVLDLLGGGGPVHSKKNSVKIPAPVDAKKSNVAKIIHSFPALEDYTKAGIYKKVEVPRIATNYLHSIKTSLPGSRGQYFNGGRAAIGPLEQHSNLHSKFIGSNFGAEKTAGYLSSAQQWRMYWDTYNKLFNKRNFIAKSPSRRVPAFLTTTQALSKSYPMQGYSQSPKGNFLGRTCPAGRTLPCAAVSASYSCKSLIDCGINQRINCCPTFCPYKPYVCIWT